MKETKKYVLMQADTNSEWDSCDLALIEVEELKRVMGLLTIPQDSNFDFVGINTDSVQYFAHPTDVFEVEESEEADLDLPCIVEWDEDKIESLPRPENSIRYGSVTYHKWTKSFTLNASGKHTGESFWGSISSVEINELKINEL